jgi:hypothetical protein
VGGGGRWELGNMAAALALAIGNGPRWANFQYEGELEKRDEEENVSS